MLCVLFNNSPKIGVTCPYNRCDVMKGPNKMSKFTTSAQQAANISQRVSPDSKRAYTVKVFYKLMTWKYNALVFRLKRILSKCSTTSTVQKG